MGALVVAATLLVSAVLGWPITALMLRIARVRTIRAMTSHAGRDVPLLESAAASARGPEREAGTTTREVLRGGTSIGVLERIAVTACVLAGQPALISLVVAIKGLGRYPELAANPAATERFIIGTFASLLVAVGCGAAGVVVMGHVG